MAAIEYPAGLPCPQTSTIALRERRAVSPGMPQRYRRLSQNPVQTETLTFVFPTFAQADRFMSWWRDDLSEGGAWFSAHWPVPQGGSAVRKFITEPEWSEFVPLVGWRVSVQAEVRGAGTAQVDGNEPPPPGDGFDIGWWDPVQDEFATESAAVENSGMTYWNFGASYNYGGIVMTPDANTNVFWELASWEPVIPGDPEPDWVQSEVGYIYARPQAIYIEDPDIGSYFDHVSAGIAKFRGARSGGSLSNQFLVLAISYSDSIDQRYHNIAWYTQPVED